MRFSDALAEVDSRQPEHMPKPDLERIGALVELMDHPQRTYPTVHVTGTNGKTTAARLVARLACAHGLTTGLFTSPHLRSVTERLELCGTPITESEFGAEFEHVLPYLRAVDERVGRVTYFEALTALAFLWFADKPVGLGVFEVGMGGTWDATNVIAGDVAVPVRSGSTTPSSARPSPRSHGRRRGSSSRTGSPWCANSRPRPSR
jgi:dihydrofolate synthase/folylpolyglutamate synthase